MYLHRARIQNFKWRAQHTLMWDSVRAAQRQRYVKKNITKCSVFLYIFLNKLPSYMMIRPHQSNNYTHCYHLYKQQLITIHHIHIGKRSVLVTLYSNSSYDTLNYWMWLLDAPNVTQWMCMYVLYDRYCFDIAYCTTFAPLSKSKLYLDVHFFVYFH